MGTADQHALDIQAGRCGGLGRMAPLSSQLSPTRSRLSSSTRSPASSSRASARANRSSWTGGAPLEIDAVPGELDAERWRNGDLGKPARPTSGARSSALLSADSRRPRRVCYPLIPLSIRLLMIWRRPMMKTTSTGRLAMTAIASICA